MLIEVERDIIEAAVKDADARQRQAESLLNELTITIIRGKHLVHIPVLETDEDLLEELKTRIGTSSTALLKRSQKDKSKFHTLISKLNTKAILSYNPVKADDRWKRIIHINPSTMPNFELGRETHLIGENLMDIKVFESLFTYYSKSIFKRPLPYCYYPLPGGGATTAEVYKKVCNEKQHLCLVITDSDLKVPCMKEDFYNSLEMNSTAKKVYDVHTDCNSPVTECYIMRHVSEIENLIPSKIYKALGNTTPQQTTVLNHDYSYFDMKKGLGYCRLRIPEIYSYWTDIYRLDVDFSEFDALSAQYDDFSSFKSVAKGRQLLGGWGDDVLKKIIEDTTLSQQLSYVTKEDLSSSQHKEWSKIGELILNWTCSLGPMRA